MRQRKTLHKYRKMLEHFGIENVSMDMSGNCQIVIKEGVKMVHAGTTVFGVRDTPDTGLQKI